jgi:hypothetical protein
MKKSNLSRSFEPFDDLTEIAFVIIGPNVD